jgi:hypothetical protein
MSLPIQIAEAINTRVGDAYDIEECSLRTLVCKTLVSSVKRWERRMRDLCRLQFHESRDTTHESHEPESNHNPAGHGVTRHAAWNSIKIKISTFDGDS